MFFAKRMLVSHKRILYNFGIEINVQDKSSSGVGYFV